MSHSFIKKTMVTSMACLLFIPSLFQGSALASPNLGTKIYEQPYSIAPGVTLKKENFQKAVGNNTVRSAMNYMVADPSEASVSLQIAFGEPFNKLTTVTDFAHRETRGGHHVVGSSNASFFLWEKSGEGGVPANLVARNNEILRLGRLSSSMNDPIFNRYAFGITADGTPKIDSYKETIQAHFNGKSVPIQLMNTVRDPNQVVLFTPSLGYNVPRIATNDSTEIYVKNASQDTNKVSFGDNVTGTVSAVSRNNKGAGEGIPADGFVIAANGKALSDQLAGIQVGDTISYSVGIDDKWMNSQSMVASGPLLVKDGAISISMNESSYFAKNPHARSAVGVTKDNKLLLVTVDGNIKDYSNGVSLRHLAEYMVSIGAVAAMNLDGGGSSAMVSRIMGHDLAYLVNRPLDGYERRVTNAVQILSTVPRSDVAKPVVELESFSTVHNWYGTAVNGIGGVSLSQGNEPKKPSGQSAKLSYDFIKNKKPGTAVSYLVAKQPLILEGNPLKIGMWAHGDGKENWLRLLVNDRNGKSHFLDFTAENKFNWYGWGYVTANIPASIPGPISISRVYLAQTKEDKKTKGTIYLDNLVAIYDKDFDHPLPPSFRDVNSDHWAMKEISHLVNDQVITGFPNGTFQPSAPITREQVATMLVRQLKLDTNNRTTPEFKDVSKNYAYDAIATVAELDLMTGRREGYFDPEATLMRAEAATILQRAYQLSGGESLAFPDVPTGHWAYEDILTLAENNITTGFPDGTFAPDKSVTRAEFSTFLYRVNLVKK